MIAVPHQAFIVFVNTPVSFRRGIDGLCAICREILLKDPMSGAVFVFRNRKCNSLRLLTYDGSGFWLCTKRLSKGRFFGDRKEPLEMTNLIEPRELQVMLWGGNPRWTFFPEPWQRVV